MSLYGELNRAHQAGLTQEKMQAIRQSAERLGCSPVDLCAIIGFESAGTYSPSKWGGAGGKYLGLCQAGPAEQAKYGIHPGQSFAEQLTSFEGFFRDRFAQCGRLGADGTLQGADLKSLYTCVLNGNPNANPNIADANGTTAAGAVDTGMKGHYAAAQNAFSQFSPSPFA